MKILTKVLILAYICSSIPALVAMEKTRENASVADKDRLTEELFTIVKSPNVSAEALEKVRQLIDHGANLKAQDADGMTPLDYAAEPENRAELCRLLLRYMLIQPIATCGPAAECRSMLSNAFWKMKESRLGKDLRTFILRSPELEKEFLYVLYDDYIQGREMNQRDKDFLMTRLPELVSTTQNLDVVRSAMLLPQSNLRIAVQMGYSVDPELEALLDPKTLKDRLQEILFEKPDSLRA